MSPAIKEVDWQSLESVTINPGHTLVGGTSYEGMPEVYLADLAAAEMTGEVEANPGEAEQLRRARKHIREGAGRWLRDDENVSDAID